MSLLDPALVSSYAADLRRLREDPGHQPEESLSCTGGLFGAARLTAPRTPAEPRGRAARFLGPLERLLAALLERRRARAQVIPQRATRQCGVPEFALLVGRGIAIAVCVRRGGRGAPRVLYKRLRGTAENKFAALAKLHLRKDFAEVPGSGGVPFVPPARGRFRKWPSLRQIFVRTFSGIQTA